MMLHTKYQGSRPFGFRKEDFLSFDLENLFIASVTWIYTDKNHLNNFARGPPKDHLCEIILKLDRRFRRSCHLSQLLTDDVRRLITKAHLVTT